MIAKFKRISLHPWIWWIVVKRALASFSEGQGAPTVEQRRRLLGIEKVIDSVLDPTDPKIGVVESPFLRLSSAEIRRRERRNDEILKADPVEGYYRQDEVVDGRVVPGFRPVPKPELRVVVDLPEGDARVVENAVEKYAANPKLDNTINESLIAAIDGIKGAEVVEIDTEAAKKP